MHHRVAPACRKGAGHRDLSAPATPVTPPVGERRTTQWWWLVVAAIVSGAVYAVYVARYAFLPYNLYARRIYIFDVVGLNGVGLSIYLGGLGLLFAAAIAAWRAVSAMPDTRFPSAWAIAPPILFAVLLTVTMPLNSRDLFHYIMEGRILSQYGGNPLVTAPSAFPNDPLIQFSNWKNYPSPYGPLWVLLAAAVTFVARNSLLASVVLFKLVSLVGYLATAAFIWRARRAGRATALAPTVLWLWHPLVLLELIGNGHNDSLMLAFLAGAFYCQVTGRPRAALLAVTVAALVKYTALPFLPLLLWHQVRGVPRWRERLRVVLRTGGPVVVVIVAALAPFWVGPRTLGFVRESEQFYASLPHFVRTLLRQELAKGQATTVVRFVAGGVLLAGYWVLMARTSSVWESFLRAAYWLTVLLLVTWSFFVPWYVTWLILAAAVGGWVRAGWQVWLFGLAAELSYIVQFYLPIRRPGTSLEQRSAITALVVFIPLLLVLLPWHTVWRFVVKRRSRRTEVTGAVPESAGH